MQARIEQRKKMSTTFSSLNGIEDHYDGVFKDNTKKKVMNNDFLNGLKLVDVPDSDDECYFWKLFIWYSYHYVTIIIYNNHWCIYFLSENVFSFLFWILIWVGFLPWYLSSSSWIGFLWGYTSPSSPKIPLFSLISLMVNGCSAR